MVNQIFLDMDGVLTDFNRRYREKFGVSAAEVDRKDKNRSVNWTKFVEDKEFETLDWHFGGEELLAFLISTKIPITILSSSGGEKMHEEVSRQKNVWLDTHKIPFKRVIVPGRRLKKEFARSDTLLIDDTIDVVDGFAMMGGYSILHKDLLQTISLVQIYTHVIY